jgi:hypothetical protein
MGGGSFGEAGGQLAAGQELDKAEIFLEGLAEGPMTIPTVLSETLKETKDRDKRRDCGHGNPKPGAP